MAVRSTAEPALDTEIGPDHENEAAFATTGQPARTAIVVASDDRTERARARARAVGGATRAAMAAQLRTARN
jgi:hypothetical protein